MLIPVDIHPPASWDALTTAIDAADLSIGESLFVAKALIETALSGVDADLRPALVAGFVRALQIDDRPPETPAA